MNWINHKGKYRNSLYTWRITWTIGTLILVIDHFVKIKLYIFYSYFFLMGCFPLINWFLTYATIDATFLVIYFGPFYKRDKIEIELKIIKLINIELIPNSFISNVGGRIRIPVKQTVYREGLVLELNSPISERDSICLKKTQDKLLSNKWINLSENNKRIILRVPPEGGYIPLLTAFCRYLPKNIVSFQGDKFSYINFIIAIHNYLILCLLIVFGLIV